MKTIAYVILGVALIELTSAVTKDYLEKALAAKDKCAKEYNIEDSVIQDFVKLKKLPETENGKCMLACFMEQMEVLVDGKLHIDNWLNINKKKWDDAKYIEMADEVVKHCSNSVSADGKNKCHYASELMQCGLAKGKEMGIPAPDLGNIKSR